MTELHGFRLVREQDVPEVNSKARLYEHIKTGAELLSIENDDENKSFGITFTTLPDDSTGVPHILEHAVLNGSRKYPVKEPFVELLKSSVATFINAMTFSDKTTYPVASQNTQDFYNLIDVYLDAVFYPRISPEILKQEGWHLELEAPDDQLQYRGVVFNEMKGAYSSPDNLLSTYTQSALFPDNVYAVDSGGDPKEIPDLTYEQFKQFHETFYHPSNSRIYFYGDDDPTERLRIMDEYLRDFDRLEVDSRIASQAKFDEPVRTVRGYDAGDDDDKKGMVTVSWLLAEPHDAELSFALNILDHILVGTSASPLRKALIDSGLGEDVTGGGLHSWGAKQLYFSTGMKGIDVADANKVEDLILETLQNLAEGGIDPGTIEASVNTIEFQLREYNTGGAPRGLVMMLQSLTTWLYNGDPLAPLAFEQPLQAIKDQLMTGEPVFERLIREYFLENTHRSTLVLEPQQGLRQEWDALERERLDKIRAGMTEEDVERVIEETRLLRELQEKPDDPAELAKIPSLGLEDLDKHNKTIPAELLDADGTPVLYHDIFSNGIFYLDVGFNLKALPQDLLPYISLFAKGLLEMGTETEDFVALTQRIGSKTGGIGPDMFTSEMRQDDDSALWLFVRGKSTLDHTQDLLDILRDILLTTNFDNKPRLQQMVLKEKAALEARLIPAGHVVVNRRLRSHLTRSSWVTEQVSGISYLFFIRELVNQIESDWNGVLEKLEAVRSHLLRRDVMMCNVTLDSDNWQNVQPQLNNFIGTIPAAEGDLNSFTPAYVRGNEGLTIPAQVNYVGMGGNLYDLGYEYNGSVNVITKSLSRTYLWDRVRVQGGAYGVFGNLDANSGVFAFASYRDPNLMETLETYRKASDYLKNLQWDRGDVVKAIVGAIGSMDSYLLPDAKGYSSLQRYLIGYTDEMRQQTRDEIMATTLDDFHNFGEVLGKMAEDALIVVLGSAEAIEKTNTEHANLLPVTKIL